MNEMRKKQEAIKEKDKDRGSSPVHKQSNLLKDEPSLKKSQTIAPKNSKVSKRSRNNN